MTVSKDDLGKPVFDGFDPMQRFFKYEHLPAPLQAVSMRFSVLAHDLCLMLPGGPERTVALRKLLESKDCAVRAMLDLAQSVDTANPTK